MSSVLGGTAQVQQVGVFSMSNNDGHNNVYWSNRGDTIVPLKDYADPNMPLSWSKDLFVFKPELNPGVLSIIETYQ